MINEYEQIEASAYPMFYVYVILVSVCFLMTALLYQKWVERKREANRLLMFTFLSYSLSFLILLLGYLQMYFTGEKQEFYQLSLALSFGGLCISNIILSYFVAEIFGILRKDLKKNNILGIIITILVLLPWNGYGLPANQIEFPLFRPITNVCLIIWAMILYTRISNAAFRIAKKTENPIAQSGFRLIGWAHIMLDLFLFFMAADTIYFTVFELPGYIFLIYIAYIFCAFFFLTCYLGFIMPEWLKSRIMKKSSQKSPNNTNNQ